MRTRNHLWLAAACAAAATAGAAETVWLSSLDLKQMTCGWANPKPDHSVDGNPIKIGGRTFTNGVGTHAESSVAVELNGGCERFQAWVGCDDESRASAAAAGKVGSVEFAVKADGRRVWTSGVMHPGDAAKEIDLDVRGVKTLALLLGSAADGIDYDHADWAEARFLVTGLRPKAVGLPPEPAVVLTPRPPRTPRITGARVTGVRPGHPFLFTVPATGERPMVFAAEGLPEGLQIDPQTGIITGAVAAPGGHRVLLRAKNAVGQAERELKIVVGETIALTPPMGWNSWNCFASAVDADKVRSAAEAMVHSGLIQHGWTYVNIDDYWQVKPGSDDPTLKGPERDGSGRILPNKRFPDMKGLADYVHALGLKIGLYSSPGPLTCGGCVGSYQHEELDARQYAEWGFDYLKHDWCSYGKIAKGSNLYELMKPYFVMRDALRKQHRDILYSLCQYGMGNVSAWGDKVGGNCWRTTGDITDTWSSLSGIGFSQAGLEHFAGPGRWNDPDMLIVGHVGWGPKLHPTRLTPNEQYTHITLWCLLASPLLIGCDLEKLDDFTLNLLTNDEVIEVNQDPLGRQAARVAVRGSTQVWAKAMEDGSIAVGLFNLSEDEQAAAVEWADLGISGARVVRDVWRQKDLGPSDGRFETLLPRHGCTLLRLRAP